MLIYTKGGHWNRIDAEGIRDLPPQPPLTENCVAVWEPDRQLVGVIGLEGDSRHAAVLIERRLRSEGTIDQETKILLHHVERVGSTYQALYSSVAMREWQQLHNWSSSHSVHCAWVPFVRLAWSRVRPDRGVVVHTSDALHFFARSGARIVFCSVVLMDMAHESLVYNAAALSERAREEMVKEGGNVTLEPLRVTWLTSLVRIEEDEARQLRESFGASRAFEIEAEDREVKSSASSADDSEFGGVSRLATAAAAIDLEPMSSFDLKFDDMPEPATTERPSNRINMRTSLLTLAQDPPTRLLLNGSQEKVLITAERWFGAFVLLAVAFAAGGLYLAANALRDIARLNDQIQAVRAEAGSAESDLGAAVVAEPKSTQAQLAFLDTLRKVQADLDVADIMTALRVAAGTDLRILSVRSEELSTKEANAPRAVMVDGLLSPNAKVSDSVALSAFVRALARSGYTAMPAESRSSGTAAADVSSRLFSYRITRSDATTSKESS